MLPKKLFHASAYLTQTLRPSFKITKTLVRWDGTESNEYLYASTDRDIVELLGFASALEKKIDVDRFHTQGDTVLITIPKDQQIPSRDELIKLEIFVYEIQAKLEHNWAKNNNSNNNLDSEWKTKNDIPARDFVVEPLQTAKLFEKYKISFTHSK